MNRTARTTLAAALLLGALATDRTDAADWYMQANLTEPAYQDTVQNQLPAGYRPISVNAHGPTDDARFAVIAVPDPGTPWEARHHQSSASYEADGNDLVAQGFRLVSIDGYGTFPNEFYVSAWVDDGLPEGDWAAHHRMTIDDVQTLHADYTDDGFRMTWISGIGTNADNLRYAAIWQKNTEGWSSDVFFNVGGASYQGAIESRARDGFRPICVSIFGTVANPVVGAVFVRPDGPNWEIQPNWKAKHGQTGPEFDAFADAQSSHRPICAVLHNTLVDPHFAHLWVKDTAPPVFSKTGPGQPALSPFDTAMQDFMVSRKISRGSLAVTVDERLIYSRGFTYAPPTTALTQPDALFRTASISKPITATAIMQLVESAEFELTLDTKLADIPGFDANEWQDTVDFNKITIEHLLQHRAGFNSDSDDGDPLTFDPMFRDDEVSDDQNVPLPVAIPDIINYMEGFDFPFEPGNPAAEADQIGYAYSNFGYSLLGRVIEAISGQDYESYVHDNVLCPIGAGGMQIGGTLVGEALPGEVDYREPMNRYATSVIDGVTQVKSPYGGFNVPNMDAHGAWVGSAVDLARFVSAFTDPADSPLLSEASIVDTLWDPTPQSGDRYGAGWKQNGGNTHTHWYHNGSLPGTYGYIIRRTDGVTMSVLFNQRSDGTETPLEKNDWEIKTDLMAAADTIGADPFGWPGGDLFDDGETCDPSGPVPGDADGDGDADVDDIVLVVINWGCVSDPATGLCPGDTNLDGQVDVDDIVEVIINWTS